ncbi:hypothetical protein F5Y05DRAFT_409826 [Hypoxylon sp. FL0543]|nr:hypothetical protein F5Y05DRAFT_409826 [Hypoxylon sp. FL0543]
MNLLTNLVEHAIPLFDILLLLLSYAAAICAQIETLVFKILQEPSSTPFRMFPPPDIAPSSPIHAMHIVSVCGLAFVPVRVGFDQGIQDYAKLVGHIITPLAGARPAVAYALMFGRAWLGLAIWNAVHIRYLHNEEYVVLSLTAGWLAAIL